jgi:hypothetical protein
VDWSGRKQTSVCKPNCKPTVQHSMIRDITNRDHAGVGKRSGERVVIDEISEKPLSLIYGSELAEQRIKHEIREADENVYKKGFVVDVNVRSVGGKPVAYAVTNIHQVIDLPE